MRRWYRVHSGRPVPHDRRSVRGHAERQLRGHRLRHDDAVVRHRRHRARERHRRDHPRWRVAADERDRLARPGRLHLGHCARHAGSPPHRAHRLSPQHQRPRHRRHRRDPHPRRLRPALRAARRPGQHGRRRSLRLPRRRRHHPACRVAHPSNRRGDPGRHQHARRRHPAGQRHRHDHPRWCATARERVRLARPGRLHLGRRARHRGPPPHRAHRLPPEHERPGHRRHRRDAPPRHL